MTKAELIKLEPYFREGERRLNGQPVQWDSAVYRTARWLVVLRELLDSRCGSSVSRMVIGRTPSTPVFLVWRWSRCTWR